MKLGEFTLEVKAALEFRQFGAGAGKPNCYTRLPLLAVMAQAPNICILYVLTSSLLHLFSHIILLLWSQHVVTECFDGK